MIKKSFCTFYSDVLDLVSSEFPSDSRHLVQRVIFLLGLTPLV